jgi:enoyl-CoA hydratase
MSVLLPRHDADGICTLTLNRPEKLNALDTATFQELEAHLASLEADEGAVGCVILRGAGKAFCAGADLHALTAAILNTPPQYKPRVIERLGLLKQPVIAAVHGVCFAGGLELALACDFIFADSSARFADTHGKWGLVAGWGLAQRLSRRIGVAATKLMMMSAATVNAQQAHALGLVDQVVTEGQLEEAAHEFAKELLANSWFTNFAVKRTLIETDGMALAEGIAHEHFRYPGLAPDHAERIAAFTNRSRRDRGVAD